MKNSWQIVTILMAVALAALSIKIVTFRDDKIVVSTEVDPSGLIYENIMTRSSVRSYTSKPVEKETVDSLLRAGMAAPTAGNRQPWEFIVVDDMDILQGFTEIIPGAHMATKAPLAIVVAGTPSKALMPEYWVQDCSAASENILLAAHAMGLGAVWCGAYPNNEQNRVDKVSKLLSLPEGTIALNIIVIGYPDGEPVIKDKWDSSKVHYNKF